MSGASQQLPLSGFMRKLASDEPAPGGGGAAALCGASAAALSGMVAALTARNRKYETVHPEMEELIREAGRLRERLLEQIDEDAEAFLPLSRAYSLPRGTAEEKTARREVMEKALREAAASPLRIMETCAEAGVLVQKTAEDGSRMAVSDAGCAAVILESALKAAALNVCVNTRLMENRTIAEKMNNEADEILAEWVPKLEKLYRSVGEHLKREK